MSQERGSVSPGYRPSSSEGFVLVKTCTLPLGFLDVSGISLLDSSNASVWPSLPSSTELISTALSASGPEDVSSSGSHERGGEWPSPVEAFQEDPGLMARLP